jgi:predicted RNA binding protein YcfA (HicA-like mRNA interferase family)
MKTFKEWLETVSEDDKRPTVISNREARDLLHKAGYVHDKKRGIHDIWKHAKTGKIYPLPRHKELSPAISKQVWDLGTVT